MTASALLLAVALIQTPADSALDPVIVPSEAAVAVGSSRTLEVRDADRRFPSDEIVWRSTDREVIAVDAAGRVTALRPGTARVAAVIEGRTLFATIRVPELPAERLEVGLPLERIAVGGSAPLEWVARDRLGHEVPIEGVPTLLTSDPAIVAVEGATGRIFGVAPGEATVTVALPNGLDASVGVRVAPGAAPQLDPTHPRVRTGDVVRFTAGAGHAPGWSVEGKGAGIHAEGAEGVFVAEEPGRYVVTARIGRESVQTAVVEVEEREYDAELVLLGRGPISDHHSGDMWVFEGVDRRDYVYLGTYMHDWMKVWDVTDPANAILTDSIQLDARRINDVKIHPDRRLGIVTREGASNRRNGIVLLDLADPSHPEIISEYTETVSGGVHNVWIDGERDLVYAAHNGTSSMHILDISDPAAVEEVGRWGLEKDQKTLHDVIVQDGYVYLSYWNDGIVMLDVGAGSHGGTPTEPVEVSRFAYPIGNTHVAWRAGDYLFIGDELFPPGWDPAEAIHARGYIHVVDYSDPEHPVEVATYEVPEAGVHNIWIEGDRMYLGYYQAGLRVVDISGELRGDLYAQGREVARILTTDANTMVPNWPMAWGAQIHKGRIYSSDLNSGIWVTQLRERRVVFE
ncbi:MAG: Ig-like domain-containing protein [Longimicrobiales bacterium]|nr:Ig-like domain-containing protein [Longimicrobiales bacterium]